MLKLFKYFSLGFGLSSMAMTMQYSGNCFTYNIDSSDIGKIVSAKSDGVWNASFSENVENSNQRKVQFLLQDEFTGVIATKVVYLLGSDCDVEILHHGQSFIEGQNLFRVICSDCEVIQ